MTITAVEVKVKQPKTIAFSSLNAAERRIRVCRDVLSALKAKRLIARHGTHGWLPANSHNPYLSFSRMNNEDIHFNIIGQTDAKEFLQRQCTVCIKGGLLVSSIDRFDKVKLNDIYQVRQSDQRPILSISSFGKGKKGTKSYMWLRRIFSLEQLELMEIAFECEDVNDTLCHRSKLVEKAVKFGERNKEDSEKRMRSIMNNVIRNEGTFVP